MKERKDEVTKSYSNPALYDAFLNLYPSYKAVSVVVLTPYNEQKSLVATSPRASA